MNVLIYSGPGSSPGLVSSTIRLMTRLIGEYYSIMEVDAKTLAYSSWQTSTSLLVLPGGRDLPYLRDLKGRANNKIRQFVSSGGKFIGFCAGAYYASGWCEFEKGTELEVMGERPLQFFPGVCRGLAYKGFQYDSEAGAKATTLNFRFSDDKLEYRSPVYYNGGGTFIDADLYQDTEILAYYDEPTETECQTAAILCQVGKGKALLCSAHPEYEPNPNFPDLYSKLYYHRSELDQLIMRWLKLLNLKVNLQPNPQPKLTTIQLVFPEVDEFSLLDGELMDQTQSNSSQLLFNLLRAHINPITNLLEDLNDNLRLLTLSPNLTHPPFSVDTTLSDLTLVCCHHPQQVTGGTFSPTRYFEFLSDEFHIIGGHHHPNLPHFGLPLLYGEVVESTQLLLERNPKLLRLLPSGTVFVASQQVTGKGRGNHTWISPLGSLQFSLYFHHLNPSLSMDLLPHLASLALVEAVRSQLGYEQLPIYLKWPNDIYALDYRNLESDQLPIKRKLGGILVTTNNKVENSVILGLGLNLTNSHPTISLNDLIEQENLRRLNLPLPPLAPFTKEELLARFLVKFRSIYAEFLKAQSGFDPFLERYYRAWLHDRQLVTLPEHGHLLARVAGITIDRGHLQVTPLPSSSTIIDFGSSYSPTTLTLPPNKHSFDIMTGFITPRHA